VPFEGREVHTMKLKGAKVTKHAAFSLLLSFLTLFAIGAIDRLRYSSTRDSVSDALTFPGGLISSIFYPEGIHTGRGSPGAIYVAIVGNFVFYAALWLLLIRVVTRVKNRPADAS
jgi:hypothetical protein